RIDSGFEQGDIKDSEKLVSLFRKASEKEEIAITFTSLGENGAAALISLPEESRRFADMMKMYSLSSGNEAFKMPNSEAIVINIDNPIIKKLENGEDEDKAILTAKHIYLSALLLSRTLTADEAKEFVRLNNILL
ncbi:MAG: hypothetical protein IKM22_04010, partial [Clostridia bacterium]|nr:hypothetical protein [Clostridia bacterium]